MALKVLFEGAIGDVDAAEAPVVELYGYEDAMLHRRAVRIGVGELEIHLDVYPARGDAPRKGALIFIGGLSAHALQYASFLSELSARGWDVVAPDIRGHGRSSGKRGDFTMQGMLADIDGAIDYAVEKFGGPVGLMGSSLGGFYALCVAGALERIDAAVSHWIMLPDMPVTEKDRRMRPIASVLGRVAPGLRMSTKSVARWDHVSQDPAIRQKLYDDPLMVWKYTLRALLSGMTYTPARPITGLRVPHLVVIGEEDLMTPLAYTREAFAKLTGDKELITIPGAGHMGGLVEFQDEMLGAVDGFLTKRLAPVST
jgi:alpha-beta hydrolase superfamily lysophospholipase